MTTYWLLVMGMWGVFALDRGLTFETGFPVTCQNGLYACLIYSDNLRPYNSLFLGLGHVLGNGNGSYVSYQILYGFLWWGRGLFTFLIFRRIWPTQPIAAFIIGALVIVHASDGALNWIGQLHQFGFMFCLVLAVYLLLESWLATNRLLSAILLIAALPPLYVSLWTYESHYFLILSIPIILFALRPKINLRLLLVTGIWYIIPVIYAILQVEKYLITKVNNYQTSVIRPDLNAAVILQDLLTHIQQSLQFWQWSVGTPLFGIAVLAPFIGGLCAIGFITGAYLLSSPGLPNLKLPGNRQLLISFGIGIILLILSFPVYLLLAGNTIFWRTQMLSGFGAAIMLGSVLLFLAKVLIKGKYQAVLAVVACSVIVFTGVQAGVTFQGFHEHRWQLHRSIMSQIAHLVPDVEDQTLILVTNLPKDYDRDPFGAALWFDFPIQLLYPDRKVVGYFVYENGDHPTDNPWIFTSNQMQWQKKGMGQEFDTATYDQVIALRYNADGKLSILNQFPPKLLPSASSVAEYSPKKRIKKTFISDRSIRIFSR